MPEIEVKFHRVLEFDIRINGMSNCGSQTTIVQNDTGPILRFTILDINGVPINLTGKTVKLFLKRYCEDEASNSGHETCSGVDLLNGVCVYTLQAGDVSGSGTYFGDVQLIDGLTNETAFDAVRFYVRENNQ